MKVVVFGASGRVGTRVVEALLAKNYEVFAVIHSKDVFQGTPHLYVKKVSITDEKAVTELLQGADAVLSCLSSWKSASGDVLTSAMKTIVPAMKANRVKRIVSLTGNAAFLGSDKPSIAQKANRAMLHTISSKVLDDGEEHMRLLQASGLDWTVVRSPVMNTLGKETYRLKDELSAGAATIHREAVARAMVDLVNDTKWIGHAPTIWRA